MPWVICLLLTVALAICFAAYKSEEASKATLEQGYAEAQVKAIAEAKAIQAAEDKVSLDAAVAEAAAQQKIVTVTNIVTKEVPIHVALNTKCPVTVGFVRVLNAAILGGSSSDLSYATGQPDDACAGTDPRSLATSIINNYAAAISNAEQLGALQNWVRKVIAASKGK